MNRLPTNRGTALLRGFALVAAAAFVAPAAFALLPPPSVSKTHLEFTGNAGTASAAKTVTVTAGSMAGFKIRPPVLSRTDASQFAFTLGSGCVLDGDGNYAIATTCVISVTFTPSSAGSKAARLSIETNDPSAPAFTVDLTGIAQPALAGDLTFPAGSANFAKALVGATSTATLALRNTGGADLTISALAIDDAQFAVTGLTYHAGCAGTLGTLPAQSPTAALTIAPGGQCTLSLAFTPTSAGGHRGRLTATSNDPRPPSAASLNGVGVAVVTPPARLTLTPETANLGTLAIGATSARTFTLTNTSAATSVSLLSIDLEGPSEAEFAPLTTTCAAALAPLASCTITATLTPTRAGAKQATVSVLSDAHPRYVRAVLRAQTPRPNPAATAPEIRVAPANLSFPNTEINVASAPKTVTISNTGPGPLTLTNIALAGRQATNFEITSTTCPALLPATLASGASCTVSVAFRPERRGARAATLVVESDDRDERLLRVGLGGQGTPSTGPLFGAFSTETTEQSFSLTNDGSEAIALSAPALLSEGGAFSIARTSCTASLAPGASCDVTVRYDGSTADATAVLNLWTDPAADNADVPATVDVVLTAETSAVTGIGDRADALRLTLGGARPNPASGQATVRFSVPTAQDVRVVLYDALGRTVAVAFDGAVAAATAEDATFDVSVLPAGVYVVRLESSAGTASRTLTVVR